jgi:hypothetical protein
LWDSKRGLMVEFVQQGATITSKVYCETLKNCVGSFKRKVSRMLTSGVGVLP